MPIQVDSNSPINPLVSDAYIQSAPSKSFASSIPNNIAVFVGTAGFGDINKPVLLSQLSDGVQEFGDISAASLTDPYDLPTALNQYFKQSTNLLAYAIRVDDGTAAASTYTLKDTAGTPANGAVLTLKKKGSLGDKFKVAVTTGALANSFNFTVFRFDGLAVEQYKNIVHSAIGATSFWARLQSALEMGKDDQGPSQYLNIASVSGTAITPALGTFAFTGGADGRGVDAADLIGDDTTHTGMYAARALQPFASALCLVGMTDNTQWSDVVTFVKSELMLAGLALPQGTSVSTAVSTKRTAGLDSPNVILMKDYVRINDTVNKVQRYVDPVPTMLGKLLSLNPQQSPGNKPITAILGTEHDSSAPYSYADLAQLEQNGINLIAKPIPRNANAYGVRHGQNTSSDSSQYMIPFPRLDNFLRLSIGALVGEFVQENQSIRPTDYTRSQIKAKLDAFLESLKGNNADPVTQVIDAYAVKCDLDNNPIAKIKQGYCYVDVTVEFLGVIRYLVVTLNAGLGILDVTDQNQAAA